MAKIYLDRESGVVNFVFIPSPVWYSVELVEPHEGLVETVKAVGDMHRTLNVYLASVFEAIRSGAAVPPPDPTVQQVIDRCRAPAEAAHAKKQKQKASDPASS